MLLIVAYLPKKQGQKAENGKSFSFRPQGKEFYQPLHGMSSFSTVFSTKFTLVQNKFLTN
jgi:hypothetical protein